MVPRALTGVMPKIHYTRDTFPRNFAVDGEVADLLRTCWPTKSATIVAM